MKGRSRSVYFATQNKGKYQEASRVAARFGVQLRHLDFSKEEIQADSLSEIASHAAIQAAKATHHRIVSEDAGFFVDALDGFPGPYSAYVFRTVGIEGILKLMRGARNRKASFRAAVAYCEPGGKPLCFTGMVKGSVGSHLRGSHGFGFDPIFIPTQGDGRTFAEMSIEEKSAMSHRASAFRQFAEWFTSR